MGAIMIAYASPDRPITRLQRAMIISNLGMGVLMVGWAFHRTNLVAFVVVFLISPLVRPRFKNRYRLLGGLSLLTIVVVLVVSYENHPDLLTGVLDTGHSMSARLNRSTNWDAAIYCFLQKPWFGQGLGGFYIPGFSSPGEGSFAHGLVPGLLADFGIIGTGMIVFPLIPLIWKIRRNFSLNVRSANGGGIMAVFIPVFLMTMTSGDIVDHSVILVFIALLAENWPMSGQLSIQTNTAD
jgi:O-antigen ligase